MLEYFGWIFGGLWDIFHGLMIVADAIAAVAVVQYRFDLFVGAWFRAELVALFMDKQFALCALKTLSAQPPDTIMTICTECTLKMFKII